MTLIFSGPLKYSFRKPYHILKWAKTAFLIVLLFLAGWEKQFIPIPFILLFLVLEFDPTLRIYVTDTRFIYKSKLLFIFNHSCPIKDIDGWAYYGNQMHGNYPSFALVSKNKMAMRIPSYFDYSEIEAWAKSQFEEYDISRIEVLKSKN